MAMRLVRGALVSVPVASAVGCAVGTRPIESLHAGYGMVLSEPDISVKLRAVTEYDSPPRVRYRSRPAYPSAAYAAKIQGTVLISFAIDEAGRVAWWEIEQSVPGLDEAAIACLAEWRFDPAMRGGKPVATVAKTPLVFRIY